MSATRIYACLALVMADLVCVSNQSAFAVIGGKSAEPTEWSSIVEIQGGDARCSGVAIGPTVVITVVACISESMHVFPGKVGLDCLPLESDRQSSGMVSLIAICRVERDIGFAQFGILPSQGNALHIGSKLTIAGKGCGSASDARLVGTLRVGRAVVSEAPNMSADGWLKDDGTFIQTTGAAVCFGDAGAGLFIDEGRERRLVGLAVRGDIRSVSYFIPLNTSEVRQSLRVWASKNPQAHLCGLDGNISCLPEASLARNSESARAPIDKGPQIDTWSLSSKIFAPYSAGETVGTVVERHCPPQSRAYYQLLKATSHIALDEKEPWNTKLSSAGELQIPDCSPSPQATAGRIFREVIAATNDSPLAYYEREKRTARTERTAFAWSSPDQFLQAFYRLNPIGNQLRPGMIVRIPLVPSASDASVSLVPGSIENNNRSQFMPIAPNLLPQAVPSAESGQADLPFSADGLFAAMDWNSAKDSAEGPVKVIVLDSGTLQSPRGAFSKEAKFVDFGTSDEKPLDVRGYQVLVPNWHTQHGTEVASVVLGGPMFAQLQPLLDHRKVHVAPVNVYQKKEIGAVKFIDTNDQRVSNTLVQAAKNSRIVNMSLGSNKPIDNFEQLGPSFLLIAAAGNEGQDVAVPPVYPAKYGNRENVIVVAALDREKLREDSNWSSEFVTIAAPGTNVPVMTFDSETKALRPAIRSGTSFAAPQVAFAAALVKNELGDAADAVTLKMRLILSASNNWKLADKIKDGAILNVPVAILVHDDVVILKDGTLIVGHAEFYKRNDVDILPTSSGFRIEDNSKYKKVTFPKGQEDTVLLRTCDPNLAIPLVKIAKIAPWGRTAKGGHSVPKTLVYWHEDPGLLRSSNSCGSWILDNIGLSMAWKDLPDFNPIPDGRSIIPFSDISYYIRGFD